MNADMNMDERVVSLIVVRLIEIGGHWLSSLFALRNREICSVENGVTVTSLFLSFEQGRSPLSRGQSSALDFAVMLPETKVSVAIA